MSEPKLYRRGIDYLLSFQETIKKIDPCSIDRVVRILQSTRGIGTIYTCGNGGSASTAEHFASDLNKWGNYGYENSNLLRAVCLNVNLPQISALINDVGWARIYEEQLKTYLKMKSEDVIVAFSVHGGTGKDKGDDWSQNLNRAIQYAKKIDARSIGMSGFNGGRFKNICTENLVVPIESTPIVEGLHVVLHHTLVDMLRK